MEPDWELKYLSEGRRDVKAPGSISNPMHVRALLAGPEGGTVSLHFVAADLPAGKRIVDAVVDLLNAEGI